MSNGQTDHRVQEDGDGEGDHESHSHRIRRGESTWVCCDSLGAGAQETITNSDASDARARQVRIIAPCDESLPEQIQLDLTPQKFDEPE